MSDQVAVIPEKSDWLSRTKQKVKAAARHHGIPAEDYWFKYFDEIVRYNRFP